MFTFAIIAAASLGLGSGIAIGLTLGRRRTERYARERLEEMAEVLDQRDREVLVSWSGNPVWLADPADVLDGVKLDLNAPTSVRRVG